VPVLGHSNVETDKIAGVFVCPIDGMRAVFSAFVFGQHARDEALIHFALQTKTRQPTNHTYSQAPFGAASSQHHPLPIRRQIVLSEYAAPDGNLSFPSFP
jgi:hypothetical protein